MKRIIFCFDGTWNKLDAEHPTNVLITAESIFPLASKNTAQLIHYDEGVGTGEGDYFSGGVLGAGLVQNLAEAYRFLIFNFTPGDEIYVFGFSRGGYSARSFVGLVNCCGILDRKHANQTKIAIQKYRVRNRSEEYFASMMQYRSDYCGATCLSAEEDQWRVQNKAGYSAGLAPVVSVTYLGVWDTVGALGIPARFIGSNIVNARHQFHDTDLSSFVKAARHAVAIDERRMDFEPTLWSNLDKLNARCGFDPAATNAAYQQQWFPGTHSSVGGGGERRGLSDRALDWVLDGARVAGLELDPSEQTSPIYRLQPNYAEYIKESEESGMYYKLANKFQARDRMPGPARLYEVSHSAKQRWHESADYLQDKKLYRPPTLAGLSDELDKLSSIELGVGERARAILKNQRYILYTVQKGDGLRAIAKAFYDDPNQANKIFEANRDKIEHPDKIYPGWSIRIPELNVDATHRHAEDEERVEQKITFTNHDTVNS